MDLNKTVEVAKTSPHRTKVGCSLYKKGKLVTTATNLYKTHPIQAKWAHKTGRGFAIHLHAEIAALIRAREDADTLVVARVMKDGRLGTSKPCVTCRAYIEESGIKHIHYIENGEWKYENLNNH